MKSKNESKDFSEEIQSSLSGAETGEQTEATEFEKSEKLLKNGKLRIGIIVGLIFVIFMASGVVIMMKGTSQKNNSQSSIAAPDLSIKNVPGSSSDSQYNKIQTDVNSEKSNVADKRNESFVPVPVGNDNQTKDPFDYLDTSTNNQNKPKAQPTQPVVQPVVQQNPQPVAPQPVLQNNQQESQEEQNDEKNIREQLDNFIGAWAYSKDNSFTEFDPTGKYKGDVQVKSQNVLVNNSNVVNGNTNGYKAPLSLEQLAEEKNKKSESNTDSNVNSLNSTPTFARAGVIIPIDIVTPVNSDYPGPVRARITSGPLAGSIVIATTLRVKDQLTFNASTITIPNQPHSYKIDAVFVDGGDSTTYMSNYVNHHYFKRYSLLTLAALASGAGSAMSREGSTTSVSPLGGVVTSYDGVNTKQIIGQAVGQVGSDVSSDLMSSARQDPTVKLSGKKGEEFHYPAGLLFLSDF